MKKRYHTNQRNSMFKLNNTISGRAQREIANQIPRGVSQISQNLAADNISDEQSAQSSIAPLADWKNEEGYTMKLADEISSNELNDFAFSCIESMAQLVTKQQSDFSQSINEVLTKIVQTKLVTFTKLAQESKVAKIEFRESAAWSKKFYTSVQPLLSPPSGSAQEVAQLTTQVMQVAERAMCQKYRSAALAKRVDFLVDAVASYVGTIGLELGLPEAVMHKVAVSVKRVLITESANAQ